MSRKRSVRNIASFFDRNATDHIQKQKMIKKGQIKEKKKQPFKERNHYHLQKKNIKKGNEYSMNRNSGRNMNKIVVNKDAYLIRKDEKMKQEKGNKAPYFKKKTIPPPAKKIIPKKTNRPSKSDLKVVKNIKTMNRRNNHFVKTETKKKKISRVQLLAQRFNNMGNKNKNSSYKKSHQRKEKRLQPKKRKSGET